jgi:hypothetical protein
MFLLAIFGFAKNPGIHDRGIFIGGTIVVFLLLLGYALVMSPRLKQETLTAEGDRLIYTGARGTRTVDVRHGRAVNLAYKFPFGPTAHRWLFLNERGAVSLRLPVGAWTAADLASVATALGLPVEVTQTPVKPRRARRTYPGSWSWAGAHPATCFVLFCVVLTVVITVVVGSSPQH